MKCDICLQEVSKGEFHSHLPDFAMAVWNGKAYIVRNRLVKGGVVSEVLPLRLPKKWIKFILFTCLSTIKASGQYHLPGVIWEWVVAKVRGDEKNARNIKRGIDGLIKSLEI
jgi:hypothetical protein